MSDWQIERRDYLKLKKWKETEFKERADKAKKERYEAYQNEI